MIVRQFLQWLRFAPDGERAEATNALARAYLFSDLTSDDRAAAEGAMLMLLDDPSPLVRRAMADVFAARDDAPPAIVISLAGDQPDIALPVLSLSPLLLDSDLVDAVATGKPDVQCAIACRADLTRPVAAAIAEVACADACLILADNPHADIAAFSLGRIVERFGDLPAIRSSLMARDDLSVATRQAVIGKISDAIALYVAERDGIAAGQAAWVASEAREKATIVLAAQSRYDELPSLVVHLRETQQLTAGLLLRALLSGNIAFIEESLAELSELPIERVAALVDDVKGSGFRALYNKAGLPASVFPAFREALGAMHEDGFQGDDAGVSHLKRRMIERVLTRCAEDTLEVEPLMTLLRRFAADAAREEARLFYQDLIADGRIVIAEPIEPLRLEAA